MASCSVNCRVLCRKLRTASRSPVSPTPAPFADLEFLCDSSFYPAGKQVSTSDLAVDVCLCRPPRGAPSSCSSASPKETTLPRFRHCAGGGADPSGTREGPGQPEHCTPNSNGFRGAPEAQAEPTGCHLGTWWDSSERAGLFSPGLYSGRARPELLVSTHHRVEAEARAEIRSKKQRAIPRHRLSPWICLHLQLSWFHKSVNVCFG